MTGLMSMTSYLKSFLLRIRVVIFIRALQVLKFGAMVCRNSRAKLQGKNENDPTIKSIKSREELWQLRSK